MKKILIMLTMLTMTMVAKAQFEAGKTYVNASLSGLDLSYNGTEEGKFNFGAMAGYFVEDNWLVDVQAGVSHLGKGHRAVITGGVGGRYYVEDNGLFEVHLIGAFHVLRIHGNLSTFTHKDWHLFQWDILEMEPLTTFVAFACEKVHPL